MSEDIWIAAQAARDGLAARPVDRGDVASRLIAMVRDGALPARCDRIVRTESEQVFEADNIAIDDEVRSFMHRADGLSWAVQTLDMNVLRFAYTRVVEQRAHQRAMFTTRTKVRGSIAIYGLMVSAERLAALTGFPASTGGGPQIPELADADRSAPKRAGRRPGSGNYEDDLAISTQVIADADREPDLSLTLIIRRYLDAIKGQPTLSDDSKIKRIKVRVKQSRPDLNGR